MSKTTNPTAGAEPSMELIWVDPAEIIIDENVRTVVDIDPAFFESIRDYGVKSPPSVWRDDEGRIHCEFGQRRVLASTMAKHPVIPALLMSRERATEEAEVERSRIVSQLTENDQRQGLTDGERVQAWKQLAFFGMSTDEIAKTTKTKREKVRAGMKVAKESPATVDLMKERQLTIDEALVMQEFEDASTEQLELLEQTLREAPRDVPKVAKQVRDELAKAEAIAAAQLEAERMGVPWRDPDKIKIWDGTHRSITDVRIGKSRKAPTIEQALDQGGVVASVHESKKWNGAGYDHEYSTRFYVEHPQKHGYAGYAAAPEKSPEEVEKDRAERKLKREQKAAWIEATELRHAWIRDTLLAQKPPLGAELWIVRTLVGDDATYSYTSAGSQHKPAKLLLSWVAPDTEIPADAYAAESRAVEKLITAAVKPADAVRYGLGYALASAEFTLADPKHPAFATQISAHRYLRQLAEWGHTLHPAEQRLLDIADEHTRKRANREDA